MAKNSNNGANLGFETELWRAADALRSNMDAAEYKHVVLGLIFLKGSSINKVNSLTFRGRYGEYAVCRRHTPEVHRVERFA